MTVTVRLFAFYADRLGRSRIDIEVPDGSTVDDVVLRIARLPGGAAIPASPLVALNAAYADCRTPVSHGDEVALIPPVAGG